MSVATLRQNPPPMAGPLTAPITGWCILRTARMTSSSNSMERWAMVVRGEAGDVGDDAGVLEIGARAEGPARLR